MPLSEELRDKLSSDCIFIRYNLPCRWLWAWEGEISADMRELRLNCGTVNHNIRSSRSAQLPTHTRFVSHEGSPEEILARMKPKARYNIRLAFRKGVQIVKGGVKRTFPYSFPSTARLQSGTAFLNTKRKLLNPYSVPPEQDAHFELLFAMLDGEPVFAMFLPLSEDRAKYLYGASSDRMRDSMSTYALQFSAMLRAKVYDLFCIAPPDEKSHPLYGLSRFKLGFGGGECIERMGVGIILSTRKRVKASSPRKRPGAGIITELNNILRGERSFCTACGR